GRRVVVRISWSRLARTSWEGRFSATRSRKVRKKYACSTYSSRSRTVLMRAILTRGDAHVCPVRASASLRGCAAWGPAVPRAIGPVFLFQPQIPSPVRRTNGRPPAKRSRPSFPVGSWLMAVNIKKVALFLVLTYALTYLLAIVYFQAGGTVESPGILIVGVTYMFVPTL